MHHFHFPFRWLLLAVATVLFSACTVHPQWQLDNIQGHLPDLKFQLTNDLGQPVTAASYHGKIVLLYFGYTHCPDVCPLIAENLNLALRRLDSTGQRVQVLAVSVDPKGDTAAAVRAYRKRMHLLPRFHYLIGSAAQLRPVWNAWHVEAVQGKPDLVDHVAYTALVDPAGNERLLYDASVRAKQVVHDLRLLMRTAS